MGDDVAELWVFGYGSLVWRPAFEAVERHPAVLAGFERRFWQGSTDHRGVPGAPGRVVTLVASPGASCAGVAYRVAARAAPAVLAALDHREKGGYERSWLTITLTPGARPVSALVYWANADNPSYLGPASLDVIAAQVRGARGPSGENLDYVLELARALKEMDARCEHTFALEALLVGEPGAS